MKKIMYVLLEQWADWEAAYLSSAANMLGGGKLENRTVGLTKAPVYSIGGFRVLPDYDVHSLPDDYEALILIGGMSWRNEEAKKIAPLVKRCLADGKVLGGICDAAGFLGTVGALNDVRHTGNDLNELKLWSGDVYTNEKNFLSRQVVRDKNVITANGTAALEFAKEVLLALNAAPEEKIEEWYDFHKLGFYGASMPKM